MWSEERVLAIRAGSGKKSRLLGTGFVVSRNRVITARHVIYDEETLIKDLCVSQVPGKYKSKATWIWDGNDDLDAAVLEIDDYHQPVCHPLALFHPGEILPNTKWSATGFPEVRVSKPSVKPVPVQGDCCVWDPQVERDSLELNVTPKPKSWNGLSGAAVVVGGRVVGIIMEYDPAWGGDRLSAVPISKLLKNSGFLKGLDIDEQVRVVESQVKMSIASIALLLEKHPALLSALAERVTSPPGVKSAEQTAIAMIQRRRAKDLIKDLISADNKLSGVSGSDGARRALRSVFQWSLRHAIDWRHLVQLGQSHFGVGTSTPSNHIDLPVSSESIAEVVMSGIDNRFPQFSGLDANVLPFGVARIDIPTPVLAPLFQREGRTFAEAVVKHIAAHEVFGRLPDGTSYVAQRDHVRGMLETEADDVLGVRRRPYYVLFTRYNQEHARIDSSLWAVACKELGTELPLLKLVRLTVESNSDETVIASFIRKLLSSPTQETP